MFKYLVCIIFWGIVFLPVSPLVDRDVFLYKWQGYLMSLGINPYENKPMSYEGTSISRNYVYWDVMQFKEYRAIYPPVSQYIFWLDQKIFGFSILGTKILFLSFIVFTTLVLRKLLINLRLDENRLWFFVANPIVYYHAVGTVHNDILMVSFLICALYFCLKQRSVLVGLFLGLAVGTKIVPIVLAPFFVKYLLSKTRFAYSFVMTIVLLYLPFVVTTRAAFIFESLSTYSQSWTYTPTLFAGGEWILNSLNVEGGFDVVKKMFWFGGVLIVFFLTKKLGKFESLPKYAVLVFAYLLLFNSVFFPWYVVWILVMLPLISNPWPWLVLGFSSLAVTWGGYTNEGRETWRAFVVWLPFLLISLVTIIYEKSKSRYSNTHS